MKASEIRELSSDEIQEKLRTLQRSNSISDFSMPPISLRIP